MPDPSRFDTGQVILTGGLDRITGQNGRSIVVMNMSSTEVVYLGDSDMDTNNGFPLNPGVAISIDFVSLGSLRAIGTSGEKIAWAITQ